MLFICETCGQEFDRPARVARFCSQTCLEELSDRDEVIEEAIRLTRCPVIDCERPPYHPEGGPCQIHREQMKAQGIRFGRERLKGFFGTYGGYVREGKVTGDRRWANTMKQQGVSLWHLNADGYMQSGTRYQHREIMERAIGRPLNSGETVHHKNGVRHDNRLENLELWERGHPPGQRVDDMVEWAHWVLQTYVST